MESNILLVDKPEGMFSRRSMFKACSQKGVRSKKKGIEGILDPFASGLLIVATGYMTRYLGFFSALNRTYRAVLKLGVLTDSMDVTGKTIQRDRSLPLPNEDTIRNVMQGLTGKISQTPPVFSNVKIKGVPARKIARKGGRPELKPREVKIMRLELTGFHQDEIYFTAEVGSGTYIRSLGLAIAEKLGTVGHLTQLRRVQIGEFHVDDINTVLSENHAAGSQSNEKSDRELKVKEVPISESLYWIPRLTLSSEKITALKQGKRVLHKNEGSEPNTCRIMDAEGSFYGLALQNRYDLSPQKMLPL